MRHLLPVIALVATFSHAETFRLGFADGGHRSKDLTAAVVRDLGAQITYVETRWSSVEPEKGKFNFREVDERIDRANAVGLEPLVRIKTCENAWATGRLTKDVGPMVGVCASMMPKNLEEWSDYVRVLVRHCHERGAHQYAIQNEIDDPRLWQGDAQQYHEVLASAYRAIKKEDPNAVVADNGFTSVAFGMIVARWYLEHGEPDRAWQFARDYSKVRDGKQIASLQDLKQQLARSPWAQRGWQFMIEDGYLAKNKDVMDIMQVHLYENSARTTEALHWLRERMREAGVEKPISCWECGVHVPKTTYDDQLVGEELVKKAVCGFAEGLRDFMYLLAAEPSPDWITTEPLYLRHIYTAPPLLVRDGGTWRVTKAGEAFRELAAAMRGVSSVTYEKAPAGATCLRLEGAGVRRWVAWSNQKPVEIEVGGRRVHLTEQPVFVDAAARGGR
jgi:hypothetical protein